MGYLAHIVLALAALGMAESGWGTGDELPVGVFGLCGVPYVLQFFVRRLLLAGHFRSGELLNTLLGWSPALSFLVAQLLFGWSGTVERWTGARPLILDWPHPAALLALAPFVLYTALSIDARARLAGVVGHHGARRFHLRMFATGLVPIVGWVLFAFGVGSSDVLRVHIEEVSLFGALFAGVLFLLVILSLPWVVQFAWETRPLPPGPRRELLEQVARRAGFRCRAILLWGTAYQMANAAVVGLGARQRVVLISDALLAQLPERELVAVFAHEMAHVARRHVLVFLATAMGLFFAADLVATWAGPESEFVAGGLVLVVFALWYVIFGWLSRRFELEADLWSTELTGDHEAMISALERVGSPHGRRGSGWRHFGTQDRVSFLLGAAADPSLGVALHRFVRRVALASVAVALLGLVGEVWMLSGDYGVERVYADLRLGNYAGAEERLAAMDEPEGVLVRRVDRARSLPVGSVDATALVAAALRALAAGDEEAARDYAELAVLRGAEPEALAAIRTGSR